MQGFIQLYLYKQTVEDKRLMQDFILPFLYR